MTVKELLEKRTKLVADARAIYTAAESAKREPTADERARFDAIMAEVDKLKPDLDRLGALETIEGQMAESRGRKTQSTIAGQEQTAKPVEWRDHEGRAVRVLGKGEPLRSILKPEERSAEPLSIGRMICGIVTGDWRGREAERRALSTGSDTAGGYLINPEMYSQTIDLARNYAAVFQAGAQIVPMRTSELIIARITGDPSGDWYRESAEISESKSTFGRLHLTARKFAALCRISVELIQDAPNAQSIIEEQLARVVALGVDTAALVGSGAEGEPAGVTNTSIWTSVNTSAVNGNVDYDDYLDALYSIENANGTPNAILFHPQQKNWLSKLKDGEGRQLPWPRELEGLAKFSTRQMTSSVGLIGDFRSLLVGLRYEDGGGMQIEIGRQASTAFKQDEVLIKARWRGDIGVAQEAHFATLTSITY